MSAFLVCRTCGKYVEAGTVVDRAWCSVECRTTYGRCVTCGRFFITGNGHDAEHCSRECTVRYQLLRTYGPEPVTVATEV